MAVIILLYYAFSVYCPLEGTVAHAHYNNGPASTTQLRNLMRIAGWVARLTIPGSWPHSVSLRSMPGIGGPGTEHYEWLVTTLTSMVEGVFRSAEHKITLREPDERLLKHWPTDTPGPRLVVCKANAPQTPLRLLSLRALATDGACLDVPPTDEEMTAREADERRYAQAQLGQPLVREHLRALMDVMEGVPLPEDPERCADILYHLESARSAGNPTPALLHVFTAWALLNKHARPRLNPVRRRSQQ